MTVSSVTATDAPTRLDLPGQGPLGLDVRDGRAFVVDTDSGELLAIDLISGRIDTRSVGSSAAWVASLGPTQVALSRYAPDAQRGSLETIELASGSVTTFPTEPLEALAADEDGRVWGFEKSGAVVVVDPAVPGAITGRVQIDIVQNEHRNVVATKGMAFASSDSTPVRKIGGSPLAVRATIETGGGIPFAIDGGLVWGARADEIWAIDPESDQVVRRIPLRTVDEVLTLDVAGDQAWIGVRHARRAGAVMHVKLSSGETLADFPVGLPATVVIEDDRAWVTDYENNALLGFHRPS